MNRGEAGMRVSFCREMILTGSAKLLVASGSPRFIESDSVQMLTLKAPRPLPAKAEKSRGRVIGASPSLTAKRMTASPFGESVALMSGPEEVGRADSILQRAVARQRGVKLLGVIGRRLVQPVVVGLDAARAKAVDQVRPVGDLHKIAMPVNQVVVARARERIVQAPEHRRGAGPSRRPSCSIR